ncbi:hypothetical protein E8E13_003659 [Curvularia kusanoi]|uniref:C2H2-type domain-containing protein n=1 Tax=Curvularia kusanoi TaxID=90978 RepID=A0A9P4T9P0_CURKU|nr:hypothetical protein E8E13_003659 [Curvularia kusanoi]
MEQSNTASYSSSTYTNLMEMPASHLSFRLAPNGPATPESCQQSFDETPYFSTAPQEIMKYQAPRASEVAVDPWLMSIATASPDSSRLSMSPSQGIATPPSAGIYSPPYSGQLQLPPYQFLEQPHPVRSRSTSHPNWVGHGDNWVHNYTEDLWSNQPFVAQPWAPTSYTGYTSPHMTPDNFQIDNGALLACQYQTQPQFSAPEILPASFVEAAPLSDDRTLNEDEDSSDEDSDWDEESSITSQSGGSSSKSRTRARSPRLHVNKFSVPVKIIQQPERRGYLCEVPGCDGSFLRPEHLRRHVKSKHCEKRPYACKISGCSTLFSRGDNLRDHYWTHLDRGGRKGKNRKFTFAELKELLGPKERKLIRRLRQKQRQHEEKEKAKKQHTGQTVYVERSRL